MNKDNKEYILGHLANALAFAGTGVDSLEYEGGAEQKVVIHFDDGHTKKVDVTGDSGVAMIRDVCAVLICDQLRPGKGVKPWHVRQ